MRAPISLSEHFTLDEAIISQTAERLGIDNYPNSQEIITTASKTAVKMEKVRVVLGEVSISINSWIRCLELNRALGSSDSSQHVKGEAVDFICPAFGSPLEICKQLLKNKEVLGWDQLILEHTWVHISWKSTPNSIQRGQVLSLLSDKSYAVGLTDKSGKPYPLN
jgi:zinc D-Ala-D-Ala carboxypeptidase